MLSSVVRPYISNGCGIGRIPNMFVGGALEQRFSRTTIMSTKLHEKETYSNKTDSDSDSEDGDNDTSLSLEDALTVDERRKDIEDVGKRVIKRPPISCPRCGSELDPGPYVSWACWSCSERVHVHDQGGGRR